jgi:hypothetical protein
MVDITNLISYFLLGLVVSGNIVIALVFNTVRLIEWLLFALKKTKDCNNKTYGGEKSSNIKNHPYKWVRDIFRRSVIISNFKIYTRSPHDCQAEEDVKKNIPNVFLLLDWAILATHRSIIKSGDTKCKQT